MKEFESNENLLENIGLSMNEQFRTLDRNFERMASGTGEQVHSLLSMNGIGSPGETEISFNVSLLGNENQSLYGQQTMNHPCER